MKNRKKSSKKVSRSVRPAEKTAKSSRALNVKQQMMDIILRGRKETLGDACKQAGITPATFYFRLKHATFGSARRGRTPKVSFSAVDAKRLAGLVQRQDRLQSALKVLTAKVLG